MIAITSFVHSRTLGNQCVTEIDCIASVIYDTKCPIARMHQFKDWL
jgi:hypothetical protein